MATTLTSTGITFPDATTQTTAGGAVNTTTVLAATAGASFGAVGTYAFLMWGTQADLPTGTTKAGSTLRVVNTQTNGSTLTAVNEGTALSGTWRAMGRGTSPILCSNMWPTTLWLRIS